MDKLLETIKNNRSVRDTTLKLYKTNLNKLSNEITDEDFKNTDFLVKKRGLKKSSFNVSS